MPIKKLDKSKQIVFISTTAKILERKSTYSQAATQHLEEQIDIMVYKLYNLTYEEVKIIDPNIEQLISKEEYAGFEIE